MRHFVKVKSEIRQIGRGRNTKDVIYVYPMFLSTAKDIMRKGGKFYAVLNRENGTWSTNEDDMYRIIDSDLYKYADEHYCRDDNGFYHDNQDREVHVRTIEDSTTKQLIEFNKWFNNLPASFNFTPLDSDLTFLSQEVTPDMYRSKRLPYDLVDGDISAYDELIGTLYSPEEREKLEWAIGSVLSGDSKKIEKMIVLYGKGGTGKSTVLDLIQEIFVGYCSWFIADELASKSNQFATAMFKDNPLVAVQDDGSLAKIDSSRINEIVSHKMTVINEKNTKQYSMRPNAMLFMATNETVDMHDIKLGITRRLLDVYPTEQLLPVTKYRQLVNRMTKFEVPAIAKHCLDVYTKLGKEYYIKYQPRKMIEKTNYLYNFMFEEFDRLKKQDPITRTDLYHMYRDYCDRLGLNYPAKGTQFGEQVKEYYEHYDNMKWYGKQAHRYVFSGLKEDIFITDYKNNKKEPEEESNGWLKLTCTRSLLDEYLKDMNWPAQYGNPENDNKPKYTYEKLKTTMDDIKDTKKVHWIYFPDEYKNHIVIDFDIKNDKGEKDSKLNIAAANEYPPTYAEFSQGGNGVHLHYIYDGDPFELADHISKDIEIKVYAGHLPLRRRLSYCNDISIATIHKGQLPLKERKKMVPSKQIENEQHLKNRIAQCLRKEPFPHTAPCVSLIKKNLDEAYDSGMSYDLTEMEDTVFEFAMHSTHQADRCMELVDQMHFRSKDMERIVKDGDTPTGGEVAKEKPIAFFDVEVFPNVFILCWKYQGEKANVTKLINPDPKQVKELFTNLRLIGFNNRDYDNHICWYYMESGSPYICWDVSQKIINEKNQRIKKWQAYGLSYTDVYDFASNPNKMSLKKWEIKLGIHHLENEHPWDEDLDPKYWDEVAEYCANDVIATEKVFNHIRGDYMARLILAKLSGLTPNDKTNKHSQQIIFGDDQNPQSEFVYTDLSKDFPGYLFDPMATKKKAKSTYKGYEVGEGGFAWSKPGMYRHVVTFDVASMHPSSLIAMNMFGDKYTKRFKELKDARLAIKHGDREALKVLLNGQLLAFYDEAVSGTAGYTLKDLSDALKTVINAVYGLTAASFDNRCRDPRNVDNTVAKRGALFMVDLLEKVTKEWGGEVIHIKTDSIKVVNPSPELSEKIIAYGKEWGYTFEVESKYDRICLIDKAQYIAKTEEGEWEPKGDAFLNPYIFKTLFSKEETTIDDLAQTINAEKGALYLDYNEGLPKGEHNYHFVGKISSFIPVKDGIGGGELQVLRDDKYSYPGGCTGWRWLETEYFKIAHQADDINPKYYAKLIDDTMNALNEFGDAYRFINDLDYDPKLDKLISVPEGVDEELPWDETFMNKPVA